MCRALAIWRKLIQGVIKRDEAKASLHKYIVYDFNTGKAPPSPQVRWALAAERRWGRRHKIGLILPRRPCSEQAAWATSGSPAQQLRPAALRRRRSATG